MQSGQVKMNRSAEIALEREERDANEEAVADESVAEVDWDADAESPPRQQERSPQLSPYAHLSAAVRELQQNGSVNTDVYRAGDRVTGHLGSIECDQWGLNGAEEEEVQHAIAGVRFIAGHQRVEEEIQQVWSLPYLVHWAYPFERDVHEYNTSRHYLLLISN